MKFKRLISFAFATGVILCQGSSAAGQGDADTLMRFPDLTPNSSSSQQAQPSGAPPSVTPFINPDDRVRTAPLAWRATAYNLATNKLSAKTKWAVPTTFDKTKSYLTVALGQLGFSIKSAYPQSGQFLVVPSDKSQPSNAQIIIVAQPTSENETALQLMVTGDSRGLDQQKVQQIPQVMLMVVQRKGLL